METSYCDDLWNGFTINKNGDVYCCCHFGPFKVGNICDNKLENLINSSALMEYRKMSLEGKLECYATCNWVKKSVVLPSNKSNVVEYNSLKRLHISFGESCNIRCIMCKHPRRHLENDTILDYIILIKNIDISPFEDILIQGGEPLFLNSCLKYMDYLETMDKKYILLTNGLLINKEIAIKIVNNASIVSISINGATKETHERVNVGSDFKKVISNISKLITLRDKYQTSLVISGRMTLVPQNLQEIPLFLERYREFGFDRINFGYDRATVPQYLQVNNDFSNKLRLSIEKVLRYSNIEEIDVMRLEQLGLA